MDITLTDDLTLVKEITITQSASQKLQLIMTEKGIEDHALRVFVSGGGCSGLNYGMTFAEDAEEEASEEASEDSAAEGDAEEEKA